MTYCIYLITNKINQKVYVGKTNDLKLRWSSHKSVAKAGPKTGETFYPIHYAIRKYGSTNFEIESLLTFIEENDAFKAEIAYIAQLREQGFKIYNLTDGGEGSSGYKSKFSPVIKEEIYKKYNAGFSLQELALEYNRARPTIKRIVLNNNIHVRTVSQQNKGKMPKNINLLLKKKTPKDLSEQIILGHNSGISTRKLAILFDRNRSTIIDIIKRSI